MTMQRLFIFLLFQFKSLFRTCTLAHVIPISSPYTNLDIALFLSFLVEYRPFHPSLPLVSHFFPQSFVVTSHSLGSSLLLLFIHQSHLGLWDFLPCVLWPYMAWMMLEDLPLGGLWLAFNIWYSCSGISPLYLMQFLFNRLFFKFPTSTSCIVS